MMPKDRIPLLVDLGDRTGDGLRLFEEVLAELGLSSAWAGDGRSEASDAIPALFLENLGQVHADLPLDPLVSVLDCDGPAAAASALRQRFGEAGLSVIVDWSEGRMEGPLAGGVDWDAPWWVSAILGGDPDRIDPEGRLGTGLVVALADHPVDRSHPALSGRCLEPLEAWRLPWYDSQPVLPDDHGTGSAGLVVGWDQKAGRRPGLAPGARILPIHLWPGPRAGFRPDRLRILCRALDGLRSRQIQRPALGWIFSQQVSLTNLSFGRALQEQYEDAVSILEKAYARAAGDWGVAVLSAAGSHPRAQWPVLPCGLAGVTSVGGIDEEGRLVRRSPRFGMDLVSVVSKGGRGPLSCAAGGGYIEQGQATSAAAPMAAGALAALASQEGMGPRRALRLLRKRGGPTSSGASLVSLASWFSKRPRRP